MKYAKIIILLLALVIPQTLDAQKKVNRKSNAKKISQRRTPENAWKKFYPLLLAAVRSKDRETLKTMMNDSFTFSTIECENDDGAEAAFKYWDDPKTRGWEEVEKVLTAGAARDIHSTISIGGPPTLITRIAPPEASKNDYKGWEAIFDYDNGYW